MKNILQNRSVVVIVIIAVLFRIYFSTFPSFEVDQNAFRFWSLKLAEIGPSNFYFSDFFASNPVGFFYFLWLDGLFIKNIAPWVTSNNLWFDLLLKLPANIADIITGLLIYYIVRKKWGNKIGLVGFCLYVFNPAIFFNSSVWGQYDGITALMLLIAVYTLAAKRLPEIAFALFALSLTLKPQTISMAPIIGLVLLQNYKLTRWVTTSFVFFITLFLVYLPFFPTNPIYGIYFANQGSASLFNCTTCFALNFWGIFGNWQNDLNKFLTLPYQIWGILIYVFFMIAIIFTKPFRIKFQIPVLYLSSAVTILVFFSFFTRMHERYLFPFFVFFLIGALLLKSRLLIFLYISLSTLHLTNLFIAYNYYQNYNNSAKQITFLLNNFNIFSIILTLAALVVFLVYFLTVRRKSYE